MLKSAGNNLRRNRIFKQTQSISSKICVNYKVKNNAFTVEKTGRYHLNKVSRLISPVIRHIHTLYSLIRCTEQNTTSIPWNCEKIQFQCNHEKTSNSNWEILQNNWLVLRKSQVIKDKERLSNCHRIEET